MKRIPVSCGMAVVLLFLAPAIGHAGWVVSSRVTDSDGAARKEATYFERDRIRQDGESSGSVVDFSSRKVTWINKRDNSFGEMSFSELREISREETERSRRAMDTQSRAGLDVRSFAAPDVKPAIVPMAGAAVAGYSCDGYQVSVGGVVKEEVWIARNFPAVQEIGPAAWKELKDLLRDERRMERGFQTYEDDASYQALLQEGFPMRIVDRADGSTFEVTEVRNMQVSPSLFSAPIGYKELSSAELRGARGGAMSVDRQGRPTSQDEMRPESERWDTGPEAAAGSRDRNNAAPGHVVADVNPGPAVEEEESPDEDGDVIDRTVDRIVDGAWEGIKSLFK